MDKLDPYYNNEDTADGCDAQKALRKVEMSDDAEASATHFFSMFEKEGQL